MSPRELVDVQLDAIYGATMPVKIQNLVNRDLDAGIWEDGYDLAVNPAGLDHAEGQELLDMVLKRYPDYKIDKAPLLESIDANLPQSYFEGVLWMVADDGTFILTDSLRVARYRNNSPVWVTPRISFDGIELVSVDSETVRGLAFLGGSNVPDSPFTLDFETGSVLEGTTIRD